MLTAARNMIRHAVGRLLVWSIGRDGLSAYSSWPVSQDPPVSWGRVSPSGEAVSETEALSLSAIFSGVMLLSRVTASLPVAIFRRTQMHGRDARVAASQSAVSRMLARELNPDMTAVIGRRVLEFHRLLWGNAYAKVARDVMGQPIALWPIEPWRCRPVRGDNGDLLYEIDGHDRVSSRDIVHIPLVSFDGLRGRSFIDYAFASLGMSISAQDFAARFFGNDASPGVTLVHPGHPKKEARDEFRRSWNEVHQGTGNARKTALLWGGWTMAPSGMVSPEDAQLLESRRFAIEEVARWLSIPPHLLRDLSRATFSNIEHQGIDFVVYSIGPTLAEYEQEYNRKLLDDETYCKHNVNALLRGDHAARASFYSTLANLGVLSINDIRELEEMNPVEGGDTYFVPLNMVALQQAIAPPSQPPDMPTPPQAPDARMAVRGMLAHTLERMGKVESHALERASKTPGKLFAWMDEFYPKHQANLQAALEPVGVIVEATCGAAIGMACKPGDLATRWCEASRRDILCAADAPQPEFTLRVASLLAAWARRPAIVAEDLI